MNIRHPNPTKEREETMRRDILSIRTVTFACMLVCLFAGLAHAEPLGKLKGMFDDGCRCSCR